MMKTSAAVNHTVLEDNAQVKVTDKFWLNYMELIRTEMLPYQWRVLNDLEDIEIAKERDADYIPSEKSHAIENFKIAAGRSQGHHYGMVFQDSDVYKWLEAAAYTLARVPEDKTLREAADSVVELIAAAQEDDGYLGTYFTVEAPERKFKRLYQSHELYCAGHFIEAAVAYHKATGNQLVLDTACRLADCLDRHFGPEEHKIHGYDGHEEIELALFRLYETVGNKRYLELGRYFLYQRGKDPDFFRKQCRADADTSVLIEGMEGFKDSYYQNHKPILEQETAEGHAVRVMYMCTGMAMLARLKNDGKMRQAAQRLWKNITEKRMYITGAVGSTVIGEAFTADYDLPNDSMYGETCASVGLMFFAHNMLKDEAGHGAYADVMERALYNTVLSGMALDGRHFFYVNPLEVVPELSRKDPGKSHIKTTRQAWFGCACCPPNLARLISSLDEYIYSTTDDTIYVDLYVGSEAELSLADKKVALSMTSQFPWEGNVELTTKTDGRYGIALRIPSWAKNYKIAVNGNVINEEKQDGYVALRRNWHKDDRITLEIPMEATLYQAAPEVREDIGRLAVQRGPLVYCAESIDNGDGLERIRLVDGMEFTYEYSDKLFSGVGILHTDAVREAKGNRLYSPYGKPRSLHRQELKLIPYYCWGNRGENEMMVWLYHK